MKNDTVKVVIGNILNAPERIVVHQTNCQGAMGSGLAGQLVRKYPDLRKSYKMYCKVVLNPKDLLGDVFFYFAPDGKIIANLFGQFFYGRDGKNYTDYDAVASGMLKIGELARRLKFGVAIPYGMGAGLAGGDWNIIRGIIESHSTSVNRFTTIYKLDGYSEKEILEWKLKKVEQYRAVKLVLDKNSRV